MQEYIPDEGWQKPEEANPKKLADALKRGSEMFVFEGNRKARRAAEARHRRSKRKKEKHK